MSYFNLSIFVARKTSSNLDVNTLDLAKHLLVIEFDIVDHCRCKF